MDSMGAPDAGGPIFFTRANYNTEMKKTLIPAVLLTLVSACLSTNPLHAQFFKNLLNTVKQTATNRANDKTTQTTNKALDKVDSTMGSLGKTTGSTPGANSASALGATSASTPGATSGTGSTAGSGASPNTAGASPDQTMRALGLMTGGGGVSATDSAAAIQSFMTGSGGSGVIYQYQIQSTSKGKTAGDTMSVWFTAGGSGRSEMRIPMPGAVTGKICHINRVTEPQYSVILNADNKTYSLMVIDTSLINAATENYQVTVVGNETVQGYSCVHSRIKSIMGSGLFKSTSTVDVWTSTSIPGYDLYKRLCTTANIRIKMLQAMESAGAGGAVIKETAGDKDYTMTMLLTKAEEKSFPDALFQIPAGYSQSNETMMQEMLKGAKH
jgi:hypothetical protein